MLYFFEVKLLTYQDRYTTKKKKKKTTHTHTQPLTNFISQIYELASDINFTNFFYANLFAKIGKTFY